MVDIISLQAEAESFNILDDDVKSSVSLVLPYRLTNQRGSFALRQQSHAC
jgi:hypothetical protein